MCTCFVHENTGKTPSKVGYFSKIAEIFSTVGRLKNIPNLKFCFIKIAHRTTYTMTFEKMAGSRDDNFFFFRSSVFRPQEPNFTRQLSAAAANHHSSWPAKEKKNILTFFGVKKNRHRRCTGFLEVHQLSQKILRRHIEGYCNL